MAKKQPPWTGLALLVGLGFAWSKLGLGAAAKEIGVFRREYPTMQEPAI